MRRLNFKLLALLLIGVVLVGAGLFGLNRWQVRRTASDLLRLADNSNKDQGDPVRAIGLYDRYLRYRPDDGAAMKRYGLLLADTAGPNKGQVELALSTLNRANGLLGGKPDPEILRRQVEMSLLLGRYGEIGEYAKALLEIVPESPVAEAALAREAEHATNYEEADKFYGLAIAHAPKETLNYLRRATLLRTYLNDPAQADQVMNALTVANPDSVQAHYLRAAYFFDKADDSSHACGGPPPAA